ncbi:type II toxin-antitoxin system VapC family toxin [Sphingomonas sp. PB4P5]|uniref:type II toxin-antitoxin system VapC family toxin n=1 Tax=Parasphingomonas puruogangriensis TaxID=3096155 RepID=UPI002FC78491
MRLLLDAHVLLWALVNALRLTIKARTLIEDEGNVLMFSAVSIAEVAIKHALGPPDFRFDPLVVRRQLLADGYVELPLTGEQAVMVRGLPPVHKDPSIA